MQLSYYSFNSNCVGNKLIMCKFVTNKLKYNNQNVL